MLCEKKAALEKRRQKRDKVIVIEAYIENKTVEIILMSWLFWNESEKVELKKKKGKCEENLAPPTHFKSCLFFVMYIYLSSGSHLRHRTNVGICDFTTTKKKNLIDVKKLIPFSAYLQKNAIIVNREWEWPRRRKWQIKNEKKYI